MLLNKLSLGAGLLLIGLLILLGALATRAAQSRNIARSGAQTIRQEFAPAAVGAEIDGIAAGFERVGRIAV